MPWAQWRSAGKSHSKNVILGLPEIRLPSWLDDLRKAEIVQRVLEDPRSSSPDLILGYAVDEAQRAAGWGQAEYDESWVNLTSQDRVLLYSFFFQIRHLRELTVAFRHLFKDGSPDNEFVVIDLVVGHTQGRLHSPVCSEMRIHSNTLGWISQTQCSNSVNI